MDLHRIITGGQTGVDRAALDTAGVWGYAVGGWCPMGRRAEDGPLDVRYPLLETPTEAYLQRTQWNVRDSDGTLILDGGRPSQGTHATALAAERFERPCLVVVIPGTDTLGAVQEWMTGHRIGILNVAGARESEAPGIYDAACRYLNALLAVLATTP